MSKFLFPFSIDSSLTGDYLSFYSIDSEPVSISRPHIVFLDQSNQVSLENSINAISNELKIDTNSIKIYNELKSFKINLSEQQVDQLRGFPNIILVEPDGRMDFQPPIDPKDANVFLQSVFDTTLFNYSNLTSSTSEILPWGVRAVWQGEDISTRGNFASDTFAFVIDSGVSSTTGDLNFANNSWHRSWISGETPFTDGNGHGTHVSGTIGALVNGKGVIGVAPGAQIVSLKVFDSYGGGAAHTTIIEAIDYALTIIKNNNLDKNKVVINLSLSGIHSPALDTAVKIAADQGIRFAVAAGNNGQDADGYSPASAGDHNNVYTTSAVDSKYLTTSWSNWDRIDAADQVDDVDFSAPGVDVLSYYRNNQLTFLSGTSMAAPHIAGLLLTGGIQAGSLVTSSRAGTNDPFAITSTQIYNPSPIAIPLSPPKPIFRMTAPTVINEGETLRIAVQTENVRIGQFLEWRISGNGVDAMDMTSWSYMRGGMLVNLNFGRNKNTLGYPTVENDGSADFSIQFRNDSLTEGDELLKLELFDRAGRLQTKVGEVLITVKDTSVAPTNHWGSDGNDTLTGGDGVDILTGVSRTGTTLDALGRGQVDVLTGGNGADRFILADLRGVFYDDGIAGNLGNSDYALIRDFQVGVDKIQWRTNRRRCQEVIDGSTYLYWDWDNSSRFTGIVSKMGSNPDELIAVFEGITGISNDDFIFV